jgi:co-chaperonin GroES (HSP10)
MSKFDELKNDWIDIDEFMPARDTFVVKALPAETDKETETGLILSTQDSVLHDRPNAGVIVLVGPDTERKVGEFVYWQRTSGYDLNMIRKPADAEYSYILLYEDAIIGNRG